jgi:hypothetical protein
MNKLNDLKSSITYLKNKLNLSVDEAKIEFETQKLNMSRWIDSVSDKFIKYTDNSIDTEKLEESFRLVKAQLNSGKANAEEAIQTQQENMKSSLKQLKLNMSKYAHIADEEFQEMYESANNRIDDFQARFDLLKLHMHLAKMESQDNWNEKKSELKNILNDIDHKIEIWKEKGEDSWDETKTQITKGWNSILKSLNINN